MKARMVIPTAAGDVVTYDIVLNSDRDLRIVFATSEEDFERWLFYLLRDVGGHVVTDDPVRFRQALGIGETEPGVVDEHDIAEPLLNRNPATV